MSEPLYRSAMSDDLDDKTVPVQCGEVIVHVHPDRVPLMKAVLRLDMSIFDAALEDGRVGLTFGDGDDPCIIIDLVYDGASAELRASMTDWAIVGAVGIDEEEGAFVTHTLWIPASDEQAITDILLKVNPATVLMGLSPKPDPSVLN